MAPESQKLLVGSLRPGVISRQRESSAQLQMRQSAYGIRAHDTAVIEDFLELGGCFPVAAPRPKSLAPHIGRVQTTQIQIADKTVYG